MCPLLNLLTTLVRTGAEHLVQDLLPLLKTVHLLPFLENLLTTLVTTGALKLLHLNDIPLLPLMSLQPCEALNLMNFAFFCPLIENWKYLNPPVT